MTANRFSAYSAAWFDGLGRAYSSAEYGAITSFTRPTTPPTRSDTILVMSTEYDDAGRADQMTDPAGVITKTIFDDQGRVTSRVDDYGTGTGPLNRTTNFTYRLDSQIATQTAVNTGATGDQTTTYTYGVDTSTTPASDLASNSLLAYIDYPDSTSGSDRVTFTYNRQGQKTTTSDSRGTVHTLGYDTLGRLVSDSITTTGTGVDSAVRRVSRTYEVRGMLQMVTSYDNTAGTCELAYGRYGTTTALVRWGRLSL